MANIAEGWFDIVSESSDLLRDMERRVAEMAARPMFSYGTIGGGPEVGIYEDRLNVVFTSRWTCGEVFSWLESLLAPAEGYVFRDDLIAAVICGEGRESGVGYKESINKPAGSDVIERVEIDLAQLGFWGALAEAGVFDLVAGEQRDNLGDCLVSVHCHSRETSVSDHGKTRTKLALGVYFQCQATECIVVLDEQGAVIETSYMDDEENTDPQDSMYCGEMIQDLHAI